MLWILESRQWTQSGMNQSLWSLPYRGLTMTSSQSWHDQIIKQCLIHSLILPSVWTICSRTTTFHACLLAFCLSYLSPCGLAALVLQSNKEGDRKGCAYIVGTLATPSPSAPHQSLNTVLATDNNGSIKSLDQHHPARISEEYNELSDVISKARLNITKRCTPSTFFHGPHLCTAACTHCPLLNKGPRRVSTGMYPISVK